MNTTPNTSPEAVGGCCVVQALTSLDVCKTRQHQATHNQHAMCLSALQKPACCAKFRWCEVLLRLAQIVPTI